ncbi:hAT family C-terminal dimerization region [Phytophthora infestans]|uniref:HAT family C-terminal dimerization region n=1 Tax=Phytophthora infestans TaxID=4787 RepID=A0A8S9TNI4_PHYIN|nr:hAT family C-terminal dimerization region [Phytophthora infestans]
MTADEGRKLVERTDDRKRVVEMEERLIGRDMLDESTEQEHRQQFQDSKKAARIASSTQLAKFAVYSYRRLIGDDYDFIRSHMIEWIDNSLSSAHPREFRFNKVKYWQHVKNENPTSVLPDLAIRVLSIAVNTATTERLFSEMIHTPRRNKMKPSKALDTQCIRQYMREREQTSTESGPTISRILDSTERPLVDRFVQDEGGGGSRGMNHPTAGPVAAVLATPISTDALPEAAPSRTPTLHTPAQRTPRRTLRTPRRRSPRLRTPTPQAHQRQSARQNTHTPMRSQADQGDEQAPDEDDLDDIGDGVDAEETFPHWVEYLEEVFKDAELGSNFTDSYEDSLFRN